MQPDGLLDELASFFLSLPLGIAALKGRTDGHKPAILVPLNDNSEFGWCANLLNIRRT